MKRIGLLGCGAIGTQIAAAVDSGVINAKITRVFDQSPERSRALAARLKSAPEIVQNAHLLSSGGVDLIVEAASQDAVRDAALSVIQNRKDLMVMSVGALLDESVLEVLTDACAEFGRRIYIPSGAILGLDGIKAAAGEIDSLELETTKHPSSLRGARFFETSDIDADAITSRTVLFDGTAREAVRLFPANINVAALLSLLYPRGTVSVRIVADPDAERNTHVIGARGAFGEMSFTVRNVPDSDNPRTSRLAVLSAIERLRDICSDGIRIGT